MPSLKDLLGKNRDEPEPAPASALDQTILHEDQQQAKDLDISILADEDGEPDERFEKEAAKEVRKSAEDSLKKLHILQMGRCPVCGEHLRRHVFESICEACGWHSFDVPHQGPVRGHLRSGNPPVEGDRCYVLKTGYALVLRGDAVIAKIPPQAYEYVEYVWAEAEIERRQKQALGRMAIQCAWCNGAVDPEKDGFHLVHVAFGTSQERHCFCSDDCFEAFRKMYPARVHRDCYERNCEDCDLCFRRYGDEAEGIRMLAKDFLTIKSKKK